VFSGAIVDAPPVDLEVPDDGLTGTVDQEIEDAVVATGTGLTDDTEAVVEWGDGTIDPAEIEEGQITGSHEYQNPGSYQIRTIVFSGTSVHYATTTAEISPEEQDDDAPPPLEPEALDTPLDGWENAELTSDSDGVVVAKIIDRDPAHIGGLHRA